MECDICSKEDESIWIVRIPKTQKDLNMCKSCYWNYINMEFNKMLNKLEVSK